MAIRGISTYMLQGCKALSLLGKEGVESMEGEDFAGTLTIKQ
jgi:hypothetical protein